MDLLSQLFHVVLVLGIIPKFSQTEGFLILGHSVVLYVFFIKNSFL